MDIDQVSLNDSLASQQNGADIDYDPAATGDLEYEADPLQLSQPRPADRSPPPEVIPAPAVQVAEDEYGGMYADILRQQEIAREARDKKAKKDAKARQQKELEARRSEDALRAREVRLAQEAERIQLEADRLARNSVAAEKAKTRAAQENTAKAEKELAKLKEKMRRQAENTETGNPALLPGIAPLVVRTGPPTSPPGSTASPPVHKKKDKKEKKKKKKKSRSASPDPARSSSRGRSKSPAAPKARKRRTSSSDGMSPDSSDTPRTARRKEKARRKMRRLEEKYDNLLLHKSSADTQLKLALDAKNGSGAHQSTKQSLLWEETIREPDMADPQNWTVGDFSIADDGESPAKLAWPLRLKLLPPNSDPSRWWKGEFLGEDTMTTTPVRGTSFYVQHLVGAGATFCNPKV